MKHLGDITKIKGSEAPVVDVVIGGSPCQDLSLAGKRAGLAGARSGLYMEQIRIIKEMREADVLRGRTDVDIRPRYMVWENVPGAFSTNGGKDFAAVIEEAVRVAEPEAPNVHVPEKGWSTSGCYWDEIGKWSVAWRVLDAQFWGVPQRRRRIALVADFGGLSAPEILFVRKSVSGNLEPGEQKRKETSGNAGEGTGGAVPCTLKIRGGCSGGGKGALIQEDKSATLSTLQDQTLFQPVVALQGSMIGRADKNGPQGDGVNDDVSFTLNTTDRHAVVYGIGSYYSNAMKSDNPHSGIYVADTSKTLDAINCGYPGCNQGVMAVVQPVGIDMQAFGQYKNSGIASSLKARDFKDATDLVVSGVEHRDELVLFEPRSQDGVPRIHRDISPTLNTAQGGQRQPCVAQYIDTTHADDVVRVDDITAPLQARDYKGGKLVLRHIVRRLTPLECERLQGFPDGWTDIGEWVDSKGKKHKDADSPRYKALGNSIAIPPWKWVLKRMCSCYERDATMASLFDGIGGFPYIWEQLNGKGSCLWASEIEEFPMAVTKIRFGGNTNG